MRLCQNNVNEFVLGTMRQNVDNLNLGYIYDVGFRIFNVSGQSYGCSSSKKWNNLKKDSEFINIASAFYTNELLRVQRFNYNFFMRDKGQDFSMFSKITDNIGIGDVVVKYCFEDNQIYGFYFVASYTDYAAKSRFFNDKEKLEFIVNKSKSSISNIEQDKCFFNPMKSESFLDSSNIKELFYKKRNTYHECSFNTKLYTFTLTEKQNKILQLLGKGLHHNKEIGNALKLSYRTIEDYIKIIKDKTKVDSRKQLIGLAEVLNKEENF